MRCDCCKHDPKKWAFCPCRVFHDGRAPKETEAETVLQGAHRKAGKP